MCRNDRGVLPHRFCFCTSRKSWELCGALMYFVHVTISTVFTESRKVRVHYWVILLFQRHWFTENGTVKCKAEHITWLKKTTRWVLLIVLSFNCLLSFSNERPIKSVLLVKLSKSHHMCSIFLLITSWDFINKQEKALVRNHKPYTTETTFSYSPLHAIYNKIVHTNWKTCILLNLKHKEPEWAEKKSL